MLLGSIFLFCGGVLAKDAVFLDERDATPPITPVANLYITSYNGSVSSLTLGVSQGKYVTDITEVKKGDCGIQPSWLTFDAKRRLLYCINEGDGKTGSVLGMTVAANGSFTNVGNKTVNPNPVSGALSRRKSGKSILFLAHYTPGSVSTVDATHLSPGEVVQIQSYPNNTLKTVPDRQDAPHVHQVLFDPTEKFVLATDLGADVVRVLRPNDNGTFDYLTSLAIPPGTGPRHGTFWTPDGKDPSDTNPLFYIVVGELSGIIYVYRLGYLTGDKGFNFTLVDKLPALNRTAGAQPFYPGEILVSPDNKYVVVSNRKDQSTVFTATNGTNLPSDTLTNFRLVYNATTGGLNLRTVQTFTAGGLNPRHFAFNKDGTILAVPLVDSDVVTYISRNNETGLLTGILTRQPVDGKPTSVVWDQ